MYWHTRHTESATLRCSCLAAVAREARKLMQVRCPRHGYYTVSVWKVPSVRHAPTTVSAVRMCTMSPGTSAGTTDVGQTWLLWMTVDATSAASRHEVLPRLALA